MAKVYTDGGLVEGVGLFAGNDPNALAPVSSANPLPVGVDGVADGLTTSNLVTAVGVVVSVSNNGYSGGCFQINGTFVGTVVFEQSNDNENWVSLPVISASSGNSVPTTSASIPDMFDFDCNAAYVRARVSSYTSGAIGVVLAQKRATTPTVVSLQGTALTNTGYSIGNVNISSGAVDSTTPLGAGATFTGSARGTASVRYASFFNVAAFADQAGTLYIDWSLDSQATWQTLDSVAVPAGASKMLSARMVGFFSFCSFRVRFVNGGAAQGVFRCASSFTSG